MKRKFIDGQSNLTPRVTSRPLHGPAISAYRAEKIRTEQVRIFYQHAPYILIGHAAVVPLVLLVFWDSIRHELLFGWAAAVLVTASIRAVSYRHYMRGSIQSTDHAGRAAVIGALMNGLLWGVFVFLAYLPEPVPQAWFIVVILVIMGAGTATVLTTYMPVFYAGFFSVLLPLSAVALLSEWEEKYLPIGGALVLLTTLLLIMARNNHRAISESIDLRFENLELMQSLETKRQEAEQANLSKSRFLAAASHDLRQPLNASGLFAAVLAERIKDPRDH